jgi:lipoprotein LprG
VVPHPALGTLYDARMPTRPRLFAVLAALSIATALVGGCSSSSKQSSAPLPDAATLLKQSNQTTKNVKSVHLALSVNGKIQGLPVKTLTGDLATAPNTAAKGDAKITLAGSDIDAQFVVFDSILYAALTANKWSDFGPAADIYDPSSILNPDTGVANVLANMTDAKSESHETINGQDTIKITGTTPADTVNGLAPQLKATDPLPTTVWIQENGDHQLVQTKLEQSPGNSIQMTLSNWNAPVQVTKPPVSG